MPAFIMLLLVRQAPMLITLAFVALGALAYQMSGLRAGHRQSSCRLTTSILSAGSLLWLGSMLMSTCGGNSQTMLVMWRMIMPLWAHPLQLHSLSLQPHH